MELNCDQSLPSMLDGCANWPLITGNEQSCFPLLYESCIEGVLPPVESAFDLDIHYSRLPYGNSSVGMNALIAVGALAHMVMCMST